MTRTQEAVTRPGSSYDVTAWDISELLPEPSEEVISTKLERLHAAIDAFEQQREHLAGEMEPEKLLVVLRWYEDLLTQMNVLWGYAHLWFCSNTQDSAALAFRNRMKQLIAQIENRMLFFPLWWKGLDDAAAERLLPAEPGPNERPVGEAHDFRHYLRELRLFSPYTLDERSEQIINLKNTNGIDAVVTLYSMLIHRLEFHLEVDGEPRTLTDDEMRSLFFSPDPDLRAAVYQEMFRVYEADSNILAQIYANRVRDWYTDYVELRGVRSPIAMRNLSNDVPDAAVETLLEVVHRNAPLFQEYFKLNAQWLGMDRLRRCDLYAPLATSRR
ncbi:MAG: M3 family oligoendopeptidase, partial [bacterium]|nr:M3 family oligoendopeptidase [bacterium]